MQAKLGVEARNRIQYARCDMCAKSLIHKYYPHPHPQSLTDHFLFSSSFARLFKHSKMKAAFVLLAGAALASAQTVYFIRHGEKPSDDSDPNLSAQGQERAQCLRTVFGASSQYNIGYIIAEKPKSEWHLVHYFVERPVC